MTNQQTSPDQADTARGTKIRSRYIALATVPFTLPLPPVPVWKLEDCTAGTLAAKFMIVAAVVGVTALVARKAKNRLANRYRVKARNEIGFFAQVDLPNSLARRADRLKIIPAFFAAVMTYGLAYVATSYVSSLLHPPAVTQPHLPEFQPAKPRR